MKVVFISGPYRGDIDRNIAIARDHAERLWKKGYAVFCPHLNSAHMDGICPDQAFLDGDLEILHRCDYIYVLPGWETSEGAKKEAEEAKKWNIPFLCRFEEKPDPLHIDIRDDPGPTKVKIEEERPIERCPECGHGWWWVLENIVECRNCGYKTRLGGL